MPEVLQQLSISPSIVENLFLSATQGEASSLLWLLIGTVLLFVAIYSLLLLYHWFRYGLGSGITWFVCVLYFGVQFVLLSTMLSAAWQSAPPL